MVIKDAPADPRKASDDLLVRRCLLYHHSASFLRLPTMYKEDPTTARDDIHLGLLAQGRYHSI